MTEDPEAELILLRTQLRGMREALNEEGRKRIAERASRARSEDSVVKALRFLLENDRERAIHVLRGAVVAAKIAKEARKSNDPG
jgi:F0F1-type ATP synthase membrane subunit b/b'